MDRPETESLVSGDAADESKGGQHDLAPACSLCGQGYHPNLTITISDEPKESGVTEKIEYRWIHDQCKRDHDRTFLEAFGDDNEQEPVQ